MSFATPLALLALAAIPLVGALWALERRRRRRFAVRHPAVAQVAAATGRPGPRRHVPVTLLALAAALLAVASARPQTTVAVPIEKASVMLVTDESGSMLADDVSPSRLQAAKAAASSFLDEVPDELLVGFAGYSSGVKTLLEPTTDHSTIQDAVDALRADGGTATGDALSAALDRLEARKASDGSTAPAAIVLLSDGKTTEGADPAEAAARAKRLGIPISTVALGTADGIVLGPNGEPLAVPPDPETLAQIAETSGGTAFSVDDADELDRVYERLGSKIGTRQEQREVSAAFAAGGLLLLAGGLGTGLRRRGALA